MMQDYQIDWLRAFVTVVDTGSITAAARQVSRSQSAVSMQLKKLEESVGRPLLNRGPRHLSLTPAGFDLLAYARQLVEVHSQAQVAMQGKSVSGKISIGVPDDYLPTYLAPVLRSFSTRFSEVEISVICEPSSSLLPKVDRGELDMAVVTRDTDSRGSANKGTFLFYEKLVWVASGEHDVWRREPLPLALHELGQKFRTEVLSSLAAQGKSYRVVYANPNVTGQLAVVDAGLAVAVLSRCNVRSHHKILDDSQGLPDLPNLEIALVRSKDSKSSSAVDALHSELLLALKAP